MSVTKLSRPPEPPESDRITSHRWAKVGRSLGGIGNDAKRPISMIHVGTDLQIYCRPDRRSQGMRLEL